MLVALDTVMFMAVELPENFEPSRMAAFEIVGSMRDECKASCGLYLKSLNKGVQ